MTPSLTLAYDAALDCESRTGLPIALSLAQWAIESGWGAHSPGNNCFGIKAFAGAERQLLSTTEWFTPAEAARFLAGSEGRTAIESPGTSRADGRSRYTVEDWFAKFESLGDCFTEHASLITRGAPYAKAWMDFQEHQDVAQLAREIAPHYATDPHYADLLVEVIQGPGLRPVLTPVDLTKS